MKRHILLGLILSLSACKEIPSEPAVEAEGEGEKAPAVLAGSTTPTPTCATNGLVANYDFNEGAGVTAGDSSITGNHGQIFGALWGTGKYGSGLTFGNSKYIEAPHHSNLNPTNLTIEAWIYPTSATGDHIIVAKFQNTNDGYQFWLTPTRKLRAAINSGTSYTSSISLSLNYWTHVAVTYSDTEIRFYIGTVFDSTHPATGPLNGNTEPLMIGQRTGAYWFQGGIDQVRIYNRALSQPEIIENNGACQ